MAQSSWSQSAVECAGGSRRSCLKRGTAPKWHPRLACIHLFLEFESLWQFWGRALPKIERPRRQHQSDERQQEHSGYETEHLLDHRLSEIDCPEVYRPNLVYLSTTTPNPTIITPPAMSPYFKSVSDPESSSSVHGPQSHTKDGPEVGQFAATSLLALRAGVPLFSSSSAGSS